MTDSIFILSITILFTAFTSWSFTYFLIKFLSKLGILDHPNERSNHKVPVPVGGGISIIFTFGFIMLTTYGLSGVHERLTLFPREQIAIFICALILAIVSFIDDVKSVSRILRLVLQSFTVGLCLFLIKTSNPEFLVFQGLLPDTIDTILTFLLWIWFINLFNFMDGIDGISGVQTISISAGIFLIIGIAPTITSALGEVMFFNMILFASSLGFLLWNWQPARIFLGDVGSVPLGFILGWSLLKLAANGFWIPAIILPLYYLGDSTTTMIKRLLDGKKIWQAHSEHCYQLGVRSGMSHARVSSYILLTNIILIAMAVISTFKESVVANIIIILISFSIVAFLLMFFRGRNVN